MRYRYFSVYDKTYQYNIKENIVRPKTAFSYNRYGYKLYRSRLLIWLLD